MKLNITQQEFVDMYYRFTYLEIQEKLNISSATLAKIAKCLGLRKKCGRRKSKLQFVDKEMDNF